MYFCIRQATKYNIERIRNPKPNKIPKKESSANVPADSFKAQLTTDPIVGAQARLSGKLVLEQVQAY